MQLLFDTSEAAHEVAFMLQCEYDGFTMITLRRFMTRWR
jgi:hypothetical protein